MCDPYFFRSYVMVYGYGKKKPGGRLRFTVTVPKKLIYGLLGYGYGADLAVNMSAASTTEFHYLGEEPRLVGPGLYITLVVNKLDGLKSDVYKGTFAFTSEKKDKVVCLVCAHTPGGNTKSSPSGSTISTTSCPISFAGIPSCSPGTISIGRESRRHLRPRHLRPRHLRPRLLHPSLLRPSLLHPIRSRGTTLKKYLHPNCSPRPRSPRSLQWLLPLESSHSDSS